MNCTSTFIRNPDHGSGLSLSFAERYKPLGASGFQACRQRGNLLRVTNVNPEQKSHRSQGRSCQNGKMDLRESEGRGAVSPILLVREAISFSRRSFYNFQCLSQEPIRIQFYDRHARTQTQYNQHIHSASYSLYLETDLDETF